MQGKAKEIVNKLVVFNAELASPSVCLVIAPLRVLANAWSSSPASRFFKGLRVRREDLLDFLIPVVHDALGAVRNTNLISSHASVRHKLFRS